MPATSAASEGSVAFVSLLVIRTVSVALLVRFQKASTAFTVTLNGVPAICAAAAPPLPEEVPGALVSPGARVCSLANAAALTTILLETTLLKLPLVNLRLMAVATLWARFVKVTRPLRAVMFVVPCKVPVPRLRAAVTTVLLSLVRKFPN